MADEKLGNRLGVILTKLNNGERFTLEELALWDLVVVRSTKTYKFNRKINLFSN